MFCYIKSLKYMNILLHNMKKLLHNMCDIILSVVCSVNYGGYPHLGMNLDTIDTGPCENCRYSVSSGV